MISRTDIAWAAGFLEGDGCFSSTRTCPFVVVAQVNKHPLERLQQLFGGNIYRCKRQQKNWNDYWTWNLHGNKAISVMLTVYTFMSPRRRAAIRKSLSLWMARANGKGGAQRAKTHCPQGHPYSGANLLIQPSNGGRKCRACRDAVNAARKAA